MTLVAAIADANPAGYIPGDGFLDTNPSDKRNRRKFHRLANCFNTRAGPGLYLASVIASDHAGLFELHFNIGAGRLIFPFRND